MKSDRVTRYQSTSGHNASHRIDEITALCYFDDFLVLGLIFDFVSLVLIVGNVCKVVVSSGHVVNGLKTILSLPTDTPNRALLKESMWMVSNIVGSSQEAADFFVAQGFTNLLIYHFINGAFKIKTEVV